MRFGAHTVSSLGWLVCAMNGPGPDQGHVAQTAPKTKHGVVLKDFPKQATPVLDASICYKVIYTAVVCGRLARSLVILHGVAKTSNAFPNPDR